MSFPRVPFADAIADPLLFKPHWDELSIPQRACLAAAYGLPLSTERELRAWSMLQGGAVYNELGEVLEVREVPYSPRKYSHVVLVVGRRSGKTTNFASLALAYEALLGGHTNDVAAGETVQILQVAQDLATAKYNLRLIQNILERSKVGEKQLLKKDGKVDVTADTIRLKHGVHIVVGPPNIKQRGKAIAACGMDEFAFWARADESAAPDFEVEAAVRPAMAQFAQPLLVQASTPFGKLGLLWKYYQAGTLGGKLPASEHKRFPGLLVLHAPSAAMENPRVRRSFLLNELAKDPEKFAREFRAEFSDAISSFLNSALLRGAIDVGVMERPAVSDVMYVAALDPAFRGDRFTFTILHHEKGRGIVQDLLRVWTPEKGVPVSPGMVLDEVAALCKQYRIASVVSDQFHFESLAQLAVDRGFNLEPSVYTNVSKPKILGNLQQILNQQKLRLLDHPGQLDELLKLERVLTGTGGVKIAAPGKGHDDMATALAQAAFRATWLLPSEARAEPSNDTRPPVHVQLQRAHEARIAQRTHPEEEWFE